MKIDDFKQKYGKGWLTKWKAYNKPDNDKYTKHGVKRRGHWGEFEWYREQVKRLTENNTNEVPDIHKRGFNSYHLDHKISIKYGFANNIPAENIAHASNLEILPWKDNICKSDNIKVDGRNAWILEE